MKLNASIQIDEGMEERMVRKELDGARGSWMKLDGTKCQ
jgi:hypothetical protein